MKYFLIAGEASGDLHGSNLMRELKKHDAKAEFCFLGGDLMQAQGGKMVIHYREMAYMGIINVAVHLPSIINNMKKCKAAMRLFQPDVVIPIDYPSFNLKMAKFAKKTLRLKVFYYISPKLWAWKSFRIKSIKKYVDKMMTIFPFETDYFKKFNYKVNYVGNPTVDSVSSYLEHNPSFDRDHFVEKNHLNQKPIIALLAGSRKQEIKNCLPKMLAMAPDFDDYQFVTAGAPGIDPKFYNQFGKISIVENQTYELLRQAKFAIVNSGTATLETALFNTPQIVVYHVIGGKMASVLKKILIKVPYVSLVNLLAEKKVCQELVAGDFTTANIKKELEKLINDGRYRQNMLNAYRLIAQNLGPSGTAERAAAFITTTLINK